MAKELNREALIIYLEDLRTFETVIYNDELTLKEINMKLFSMQRDINIAKDDVDDYSQHMPQPPLKRSVRFDEIGIGSSIGLIVLGIALLCIPAIGGTLIAVGLIFLILLLVFSSLDYNKENKKIDKEYSDECERYNIEINEFNTELECMQYELNSMMDRYSIVKNNAEVQKDALNREIDNFKGKLKVAYSVNIIPMPFRNIECIYYLCDYVSTSNESLTNAFLNCNLEQIKISMATIIEELREITVNQRKSIDLQQKNNKILRSVSDSLHSINGSISDIAISSEDTRKYAQISASNSELSLELNKQQLAYEKADFWLNHI